MSSSGLNEVSRATHAERRRRGSELNAALIAISATGDEDPEGVMTMR